MSGIGNSIVNFMGGGSGAGGGLPYELQMQEIQRQRKLAELLQQQSQQPIDIQSGGGVQAPISWGSVLAKGLQGFNASQKEGRASDELKQLGVQDNDAASALIKQLQGKEQLGVPSMAPQQMQMDATAPQLPGGPAPVQQSAQLQMPGQAGGQMQHAAPSTDEQLMAVLAARGGPQTQAIQQAMIPQIMGRQNTDYAHQLDRSDAEWKNALPMSTAAGQQIAAQTQASQQNALFENKLPMTAAQRAANALQQATLFETRRYHNQMTGSGLTEDGAVNPIVQSHVFNIKNGNESMQNVPPGLRNQVSMAMQSSPMAWTPTAMAKNTLAASRITKPFTDMAAYKLTADGLPYMQRIDAAMKHPGSVSDQDLLDSLTKLNTGGNAVTEAQVALITGHGSYADWAGQMANKFKNGGALSDNQRQQIKAIAGDIFENYKKGYQPVYEAATKQLKESGIPENFWTIPNLNQLNGPQVAGGGGKTVVRTGTLNGRKVVQYSDGTTDYAP